MSTRAPEASAVQPDTATISGQLTHLAESVAPSLFRNGKVLTRRDADGSDAGSAGVVTTTSDVDIIDARLLSAAGRPTIAEAGFELLSASTALPAAQFLQHQQVVRDYYPECADIVAAATGASLVVAFDHNIRSATGKAAQQRIAGGQQVQGPAHMVHGDYTLTSAPQRLRDLTQPPSGNDTLLGVLPDGVSPLPSGPVEEALANGRFAIINVWRSLSEAPVQRDPLALCDGRSVLPEDLVVFEIHYQDRIGENYFARRRSEHRWYTFSEQTHDEVLLIKQWDSAGRLARSGGAQRDDDVSSFSFHSAYHSDAMSEAAPERRSIDMRCAVLY